MAKTLLIVDDERQICEVLARFFTARGFRTLTASSGREAIDTLTAETPDYLLLDLLMPDLSGLEVLKVVRTKWPNLKVVVVSALEDQQVTEQAFQLGASDYVQKPFQLNEAAWARAFFSEEP